MNRGKYLGWIWHTVLLLGLVIGLLASPAQAADIYVNQTAGGSNDGSSWGNAYTDIQTALTAAGSGDTIHVAQGIYKPTTGTGRTATFQLKNGVTLLGGYLSGGIIPDPKAYMTILSGDLSGNDNSNITSDEPTRSDNSYHVVTGSGTNSTAVIGGFTIRGGNANGTTWPHSYGAGMVNSGGSPTVQNTTFTNNSAMNWGGGMYNTSGSSPVVSNVTFTNNNARMCGGGMSNNGSSPTVQKTTFSDNVTGNWGGGVCNSNSSPSLTNVTFSGNSAGLGAGMFNQNSSNPTLMNVTFSGNSTNWGSGGGIYNFNGSTPIVTNCILWGDSPNEINNDNGGSSPTASIVTYSVVQGDYTGTGNLGSDPRLGPLGDYGGFTQTVPLLPGSPAIDAGTNTGAPLVDQRGVVRPQNTIVDIGAFEVESGGPTVANIDPVSAYPVGQINVTVGGTNFSGTPIVMFRKDGYANILATSVFLVNSTQLTCTLDIAGVADGAWDVVVINPDGRSAALTNGFTVLDIPHSNVYVDLNCPGPIHNGTSWATAFLDLAGVLASSQSGDTIHVAQGTYRPTTGPDRSKTFQLKTGVTLLGGYPTGGPNGARDFATYVTTLSGDIGAASDNTDNSYNVVTGSGTDNTAIFDGFTVTGGNADGDGDEQSDGGGMYNDSGSPTVRNVIFSNNSADSGGGMYNDEGSPTLQNVTFSNNSADSGGGMHNSEYSNSTLTNVTFSNNSAAYGGGMYNAYDSDSTLTNVTFSSNSASDEGGGIYNEGSLTVTNSILWGNSPDEIYDDYGATVTYSVVQGGFSGGTNIITTNPNMGALGNYGGYTQTIPLPAGSSAIDAATSSGAPTTDQRGVARPQGSGYDIGAYEYIPSITATLDTGTITLTPNTPGCWLSDVQAMTEAQMAVADPSYDYPYGLVEFKLNCTEIGVAAAVTITYPGDVSGTTYRKYGSTLGNSAPHWYDFMYDGTTGAEINGNQVVLHFVDGQRGDDDLTANGVTVDQGGPGQEGNRAISVPTITEWGIILFVFLAGMISISFLRRQKKRA